MSNASLINEINEYAINNNDKELLRILNNLFASKSYKENLQLAFSLISMTEMYGFLSYLGEKEKEAFLEYDSIRCQTYSGERLNYYNRGQLSFLYELEINNKVFFSAPTSFGKTSIVVDYILKNYSNFKNILFVVPTNSLLEELYQKFMKLNKEKNLNYKISTQPHVTNVANNLLLLTPERFFLVSEIVDINKFDLIIMDETYKIVDSKNETITDFLESRALRFRKVADMIGSSNKKVIFLSPFTYTLTESMKKFLERYHVAKIDRTLEYVNRDIIKIFTKKDYNEYFKTSKRFLASLIKPKKVSFILEELKDEKNIVYVSSYMDAYDIVDELNFDFNIEHSDRYNNFIKHLENNYDIGHNHEWKIITALKKGVGIYVAPLPRYVKKEIIKLYEENQIKTLIVTTAFTEGVNTNACNLIFTALTTGGNSNKLSDIDILNVSGRAGRFAMNSVGKIFCIDEKVYDSVTKLQEISNIKLENYNYKKSENGSVKDDYEIDMIENTYLSDEEIAKKERLNKKIERLNLSRKDLNISLCVPNSWKVIVYEAINNGNIDELYKACINVLSSEPSNTCDSMETLFRFIRESFENNDINPFSCKPYEIKPFANSNEFIWGRLYRIYSKGKAKDIIKDNIRFIQNEFYRIKKEVSFNVETKKAAEIFFVRKSKEWILKYYTNDLKINYDAFFTETFKFISSVIQYKIPFYLSFITSIVKLYIIKHNIGDQYNVSKMEPRKVALLFENGNSNEEYDNLIDFGMSNDIIIKLIENHINPNDLNDESLIKDFFDDYEKMVLKDYYELM